MTITPLTQPVEETIAPKSSSDERRADRKLRIAYLTTEYPKVSHSFIRREILELERCGHSVTRLAIRDSGGAVADPVDQAEYDRTWHCLNQSLFNLFVSFVIVKATHPIRYLRALGVMWRMHRHSTRGLIRHVAYLVEAASIYRKLKSVGAQHLHVHFGTNACSVARLAWVLGGPPYSFTVHGPDEFDDPRGHDLGGKIEDAAFVVAITSFCASQLRRWVGYEQWSKIKIVHCAVSSEFFEHAAPVSSDAKSLVCVGRLTAQKGQLLLIDAVAEAVACGVDVDLVLAGDGEMRDVVEQRIVEHDLQDRVTITGWISEAEVRRHLLESRGLVLASFAEGLPVVIMEAFSLGRPVIATTINGIPELVHHEENGWLVTAGDVDQLVDSITELMQTPIETLNEMAQRGRVLTQQHHTIETEMNSLQALFAASIENRSIGDR